MKNILLVFAILFVVVAFAIFAQGFLRQNISFFQEPSTVKVGEETFTVDVADTPEERQKGLSGRNSMAEDHGMLFLFETLDNHTFWMKDMKFPLDIIFLKDNVVVTVHQNVPEPSEDNKDLRLYSPTEPANRVLELNAGQAAKHNIEKGKTLDIQLSS